MTLLPTWLPTVVAIAAGLVYATSSEGTPISRVVVASLVLLSLALQYGFGSTLLWSIGLILQVLVSVFVLVQLKIR